MRTLADIESRIRFLLCEELSRRVRQAETRLPHLCRFNHRQPLDTRKMVEDVPNDSYNRTTDRNGLPVIQTIGLCMLGAEDVENWPGNICEDPIDAQRCPYFDPAESKTAIFERFKADVTDVDWIQANMPEMHGLLWVLDSQAPSLPWWKVLWFKMLRIHVAPMVSTQGIENLLPPAP
jgi:hypothetical protein